MIYGIAEVCLPLASSLLPDWDWRSLMSHLVAIAIAAFLLWLAANRLEWFRFARRQYSQTQEALFAELCHAHDLSRTERMLLSLIGQSIGADRCCWVFVDPRIVQQFARNNPADADGCLELGQRLFGTHVR
jgi:hypothetical protein